MAVCVWGRQQRQTQRKTGSLVLQGSCSQLESVGKHTLLLKLLICLLCGVRGMGVILDVGVSHPEVDIVFFPQ